uniref:Uncharacterized protein n=1 Tax=Anthurium amnicola TaxID=1678845 RepID=A0A1D1YWT2_9ARAE
MSSIINKVKNALSSDEPTTENTYNTTTTNSAEPRVHNNLGENRISNDGSFTQGENYGLGQENRGFDGPATKTDGPHKSNILNKADPRVDSDRDHSKNLGMNPPGDATTGFSKGSSVPTGNRNADPFSSATNPTTTGTTTGRTGGVPEGTFGPHRSRAANAADPRVDSDLDSRGNQRQGGAFGTSTATTTGSQNIREGEFGPHSSRVANAADPRVDSDLDSRGNQRQGGVFNSSTTGSQNVREGEFGPHSSRVANAADPRVDSDLDSTRRTGENQGFSSTGTENFGSTRNENFGSTRTENFGTNTSGPGPARNTAGPHSSDLANKLDPRVDSDLDNSKTIGGDKTFEGSSLRNKDPTDAAQVPPSVLQKQIGKPTIEHEDVNHDRTRRHSYDKNEKHHGL